MLPIVCGSISLSIWLYLLLGRGGFWRVPKLFPKPVAPPGNTASVAVVIPARDEALVIAGSLQSLFQQNTLSQIFLVDDNSSDGTAGLARQTAETHGKSELLTIIDGLPLAPGWTGKLWAASQGVQRAQASGAEYLLLTDADIVHAPNSIAQLLATAQANRYDLASYMVRLACVSPAEKALIPAFVFFFLKLYPPAWIASEQSNTAGAAGGCILIRSDMLTRIGGLTAIRNQVIDDCALARAVKRHGGRLWLGLSSATYSNRSYEGYGEIARMISRTAFNQLQHSGWMLLGAVLGLFFTYLLPVLLVCSGQLWPVVLGAASWLLMSCAFRPMVRFYRLSPFRAFSLPAIAAFYLAATVHSAWQYWRGHGGQWKGRIQDAKAR